MRIDTLRKTETLQVIFSKEEPELECLSNSSETEPAFTYSHIPHTVQKIYIM
jgi:hypothetical protein